MTVANPDQDAIATWIQHERATVALKATLPILAAVRVRPVVVKGMVLAHWLYDDVADRPISDVDLRVMPQELPRVLKAMAAHGIRKNRPTRQLGAASFAVHDTLVEFETSVGPPGLCALTVRQIFARAHERILPSGLQVLEPEIHDHAVHLVVNVFKDKFFGAMPWSIRDLDLIVARLDIDHFLQRVRAAELRTVTWIVADFMARERGNEIWNAIRRDLGSKPPRPLYVGVLRHLIDHHPLSVATPAFARIGADSPGRRLWALSAAALGTAHSLWRR
jgi:hypothetical protein